MGPKKGYWTPFEPDHYLDLRQPEWADEERRRWVRYFVCDQGTALVYVHAQEARRVIEELGRLNGARLPEPPAAGASDSSSAQWPPRWRLR